MHNYYFYYRRNSFEYAERSLMAFEKRFYGANITNKLVTMKFETNKQIEE